MTAEIAAVRPGTAGPRASNEAPPRRQLSGRIDTRQAVANSLTLA
jgi:hypothetical protein